MTRSIYAFLISAYILTSSPAEAGFAEECLRAAMAPFGWIYSSTCSLFGGSPSHVGERPAPINRIETSDPIFLKLETYAKSHLRGVKNRDTTERKLAQQAIQYLNSLGITPVTILDHAAEIDPRLSPMVRELKARWKAKGRKVKWGFKATVEDRLDMDKATIRISPFVLASLYWVAEIFVTLEHYSQHSEETFLVGRRNMSFEAFLALNETLYLDHEVNYALQSLEVAIQLEALGLTRAFHHFEFDSEGVRALLSRSRENRESVWREVSQAVIGNRDVALRRSEVYLRSRWIEQLIVLDRDYLSTIAELTPTADRDGKINEALIESAARKLFEMNANDYLTLLYMEKPETPWLAMLWLQIRARQGS